MRRALPRITRGDTFHSRSFLSIRPHPCGRSVPPGRRRRRPGLPGLRVQGLPPDEVPPERRLRPPARGLRPPPRPPPPLRPRPEGQILPARHLPQRREAALAPPRPPPGHGRLRRPP